MTTRKSKTKKLVASALIASLYATITLVLGAISYGPVQFRLSEIMILLPFINKNYIWGLTIGCLLSNIIGPYGVPDIIFGTIATFLSGYAVYLTSKYIKNNKFSIIIASIWPTIINAIVIGFMLNKFFGVPIILGMIQVALGEFVVITIIGIPLYKMLEKKYLKYLKNIF